VLPCMVDARTNLSTEVLREIEAHFGALLTKTRIRNNVKLAESPSFGRTIFEHAPDSNGARDYEAFASEFLRMIGAAAPAKRRPAAPLPAAPAHLSRDRRRSGSSPPRVRRRRHCAAGAPRG